MKSVRIFLVLVICGLGTGIQAQADSSMHHGLRFYEKLAQRDAAYEHSFQAITNLDESDYWIDQANFERQLGIANFTSYLIYMKGKKDAYRSHLLECDSSCDHSELYFQKASEYLSSSDFEHLLERNGKVVDNLPGNKKKI